MSTPFGDTSYEYDLLDRLVRVVDRNGYATAYEYDKNGNRTRVTYANGYTTTYDYDLLNRLIQQETLDNDGETVVQYVYTLGAAGERKVVSELDRTVEYTYDNLYRLTSETITEGEKVTAYTYAYDNVSNRILKNVDGEETVYTYNALNQLVSDSETSYEYDLNGNLIRVIGTGNSALYEYNCDNKLVKATVQQGNNVVIETYTYDYSGNRTSKTTNTNGHVEYVKYLNDNSSLTNVLAEIDETGTVKCVYTIGADLISQERDGDVSVYLYDGHGSVVGLALMNGKVTDTYTYDAFGNLLTSTGSTKNYYRYCGEQFDSTTGLYYLRARYMDTSTGRFISQDSYSGSVSDPVSLHKYLYANSNPVMYSDPSGYMSMAEMAVAGGIIGGLSGLIVPNVISIFSNLVTFGEFKSDISPAQNLKYMLNGIIFGCFFGICAATFMTLGIIAGLTATFNFGLSYIFYIDGQQAAEDGRWYDAICSWFLCLFYMVAGFTTIALASMSAPAASYSSSDENEDITTESAGYRNNISQSSNSTNITSNSKTVTVGRWMSKDEYNKMIETQQIQPSYDNPYVKHIAYPADINAFSRQAPKDSVYVEFEVPVDSIKMAGSGWARIPGPGSPESRLSVKNGGSEIQYPPITNINKKGEK